MAKKSIKLNYIYNTLYQVLALITPLITAPYLSRVLQPEGIGQYSYALSVVSYFVLFAGLGMTAFAQREVACNQDNRQLRSEVFWNVKALSVLTTAVVLCVYFVFCTMQDSPVLYLILSLNILAVAVDVNWLYYGMEEFGKIALRNLVMKVLDVAFIFLFVKDQNDLWLYVLGMALFSFLPSAIMWLGVSKFVDMPEQKKVKPFKHVKAILSLFAPTIAIQIYTVLDKTMIGVITQNAAENGFYEQATKLSKMLLTLVTALGTVMVPRLSYYFEQQDWANVQKYMGKAYRFIWFLGIPLCFGLIGTASSIVPWFYGEGYEKVVPLLWILSFLIPIIGIGTVTGQQYLIAAKRQNLFTISVVFGAGVNFALNLLLIPSMASIGAALASVIAELVVSTIQLLLIRKELSIWQILKSSESYLLAGSIMLIAVLLLNARLPDTFIATILLVSVGAVIYFTVLLVMKDPFLISNAKSMLQAFIVKKN